MRNAPFHGRLGHPAVFGQYFESPAQLAPGAPWLWAYTDSHTYGPGEKVAVHVNSSAPGLRAALVHDAHIPQTMLTWASVQGRSVATPDQCSATGCGWPVALAFRLDPAWPSGGYRLLLFSQENARLMAETLFILRPTTGRGKGRILHVVPTGTWAAYNDWGGSNHYEGISGPDRTLFSPVLSADRPFARGFVSLPPDAPRAALDFVPEPMAPPVYPHMEWAFANGFSKKYASAGWASYDRPFLHWMQSQHYEVDVATQTDLHYRPGLLESYSCVTFAGHDEYWSWEMRDAVDGYADAGGHVARFAGNFFWQIRLEDEGRRQICYKYRARAEDRVYGTPGERRATTSWEASEIGRPGVLTFGLNATNGVYAGWGGATARGARGFPVYRPEHWAFRKTGLSYGDVLGASSFIFGYEVDGLEYTIRAGLPYPADGVQVPAGLEILALGLASLTEEGEAVRAGDVFLGQEDATFVAELLHGTATTETIDKVKRGNGMMVNFPRGKGEVFHAGSVEWVAGLIRKDSAVEQVTRNVLDRYIAGRS